MAAPRGNKYAVGNSGRPKQFATPDEMQKAIDSYFKACDNRVREVYDKSKQEIREIADPIPYTVEGLCGVLDLGRDALLSYEKSDGYEEFHDTVKRAKMKIQQNLVERGLMGDNNSAVSIFLLKNNHGYVDKVETDNTTTIKASFTMSEMPADKNTFANSENEVE